MNETFKSILVLESSDDFHSVNTKHREWKWFEYATNPNCIIQSNKLEQIKHSCLRTHEQQARHRGEEKGKYVTPKALPYSNLQRQQCVRKIKSDSI